jgi:hypothetical protein
MKTNFAEIMSVDRLARCLFIRMMLFCQLPKGGFDVFTARSYCQSEVCIKV